MISREILEALREFDTALLANTIGYIDKTPPYTWYMSGRIRSLTPDIGPIAGIAVTAKIDTSTPGGTPALSLHYEQMERMRAMDRPLIWVVQTVGSRPEHECVTGDGMGKILHSCGCLGVVTNGYCRDIAGCRTVPFAVYAQGTIGHHETLRMVEVDTPVEVGGIKVNPGELIHADGEGVIKIADQLAEPLIDRAPNMRAVEHAVHAVLRRKSVDPAAKQRIVSEILCALRIPVGKERAGRKGLMGTARAPD